MGRISRIGCGALTAALLVGAGCGGASTRSTSSAGTTTAPSQSGAPATTVAATGDLTTTAAPVDSVDPQILARLTSGPAFVHPEVSETTVATGAVTVATGGEVSLKLRNGAVATLRIPAGAFESDETVSLSEVLSIDGAAALGVRIEPSGMDFPVDKFPILVVSNVPSDASAWDSYLADRDGVTDRAGWLPGPDGARVVVLPHFSDVFFGEDIDSIPADPLDEAVDRIRGVMREAQASAIETAEGPQVDDTWRTTKAANILKDVYVHYITPLLQQAAKQCGGEPAVRVGVRWANYVYALGVEEDTTMEDLGKLIKPVIEKELDCAVHECESSSGRDHTALARYLSALSLGESIGVWNEAEFAAHLERAKELLGCWVYEVRIYGHAEVSDPSFSTEPLIDEFAAKGQVWLDDTKQCYLGDLVLWCEGQHHKTIPMTIKEHNLAAYLTKMANNISQALKKGPLQGECTFSGFPPAAAEVTLNPVPSRVAGEPPTLTMTFRPYLAPGQFMCPAPAEKPTQEWTGVISLALLNRLKSLSATEFGFVHEFDNATEYQPVRTWNFEDSTTFTDRGETISVRLRVRVWAPKNIEVPVGAPSTTGLIDVSNTDIMRIRG